MKYLNISFNLIQANKYSSNIPPSPRISSVKVRSVGRLLSQSSLAVPMQHGPAIRAGGGGRFVRFSNPASAIKVMLRAIKEAPNSQLEVYDSKCT